MLRILYRMSEYIHKSHNVTVLLYHLVFPAKYRQAVFDPGCAAALALVSTSALRLPKIKAATSIPHIIAVSFLLEKGR